MYVSKSKNILDENVHKQIQNTQVLVNILAWRKSKEVGLDSFPNDVHIGETFTKGSRS